MSIVSLEFGGFVLLVLALYYLLPRRAQNYFLLVASLVFCITWAWQFALVLLGVTLFNFGLARGLQRGRRGRLWLGLSLNLLALALFRSAGFFVPAALDLLASMGVQTEGGALEVLLPVGLSFYTLQAISYLVDVYQGQMKASHDLVDFGLYMSYFPRLLAGPIERARSFLPKLTERRVVNNDMLARSFTLIVVGLVRKAVIADTLSTQIPKAVFQTPLSFAAPKLAGWLAAYGLALYNDFAGYTNIVRGISGLFGIELSPNFAHPLFSRSFAEFWNRWHSTLSHWLRDYVFFPLGRALLKRNLNRRNMANLLIPPMATMLISGLWHGARGHTLVWGALVGLCLCIERLISLRRLPVPPALRPWWRQLLATSMILGLAAVTVVPFRLALPTALEFWRGLVTWPDFPHLSGPRLRPVLPFIGLALGIDWVQYRRDDEWAFLRWPRLVQATLLALAMLAIFLATRAEVGEPFIYQDF